MCSGAEKAHVTEILPGQSANLAVFGTGIDVGVQVAGHWLEESKRRVEADKKFHDTYPRQEPAASRDFQRDSRSENLLPQKKQKLACCVLFDGIPGLLPVG